MDIHCYSLPYGFFGAISHLLTFYTILCLVLGKSPTLPTKSVNFTRIGLWMAVISMTISTALIVPSIDRCGPNTWPLSLMAVWKFGISTSLSMTTIHVARTIIFNGAGSSTSTPICSFLCTHDWPSSRQAHEHVALLKSPGQHEPTSNVTQLERPRPVTAGPHRALWWSMPYVPSMIIGLIGLVSLVVGDWPTNQDLRIVTYVFAALMCLCTVVLYLVAKFTVRDYWEMTQRERHYLRYIVFEIATFIILSALYSDFALGALVHNWIGTPSSDTAVIYWVNIVARHLFMLLH